MLFCFYFVENKRSHSEKSHGCRSLPVVHCSRSGQVALACSVKWCNLSNRFSVNAFPVNSVSLFKPHQSRSKNNGDSLYERQVCHIGPSSEPTQNRRERQRLRTALLGDGAVLPEPGVLGDWAAGPPVWDGPASGSQPVGCSGSSREERQERDQATEHAVVHQGELNTRQPRVHTE